MGKQRKPRRKPQPENGLLMNDLSNGSVRSSTYRTSTTHYRTNRWASFALSLCFVRVWGTRQTDLASLLLDRIVGRRGGETSGARGGRVRGMGCLECVGNVGLCFLSQRAPQNTKCDSLVTATPMGILTRRPFPLRQVPRTGLAGTKRGTSEGKQRRFRF